MMVVETTVALVMRAVNSDGNFNNKLVFAKQVTTAQVVDGCSRNLCQWHQGRQQAVTEQYLFIREMTEAAIRWQ